MKGIFITQNNKINLSPYSLITTNVIMLMGLFFFSCENTITDIPDNLDCNNIPNGSASIDDCGVCGGSNLDMDECGICFGSGYTDNCGVCDDDESNDCPKDCAGIDGGTAVVDECGECIVDGDHSTCIVINEINYNSDDDEFNPDDWVELYNPTSETISIENWKFKDENDEHVYTIDEVISLGADEYLVLCTNSSAFSDLFPDVENYIGDIGFGLESDGELIRLFDSNESLVDSVEYDNEYPWPTEPNGNGPTLELIHPSLDNNRAENWAASNSNNGTPGEINSVYDDE
jgi:hypothetical protein